MTTHSVLTNLTLPDPISWHSYPKIWGLGHPETDGFLANNDVIVQEKVDGSQFSFGVFDGELRTRSKGQEFFPDAANDLFIAATQTAQRLFAEGKLVEGWTYRGEAFKKPRHNALAYDRVPNGNVILFDINVGYERYMPYKTLVEVSEWLGLEAVPLLFTGRLTEDKFAELLETTSVLGGQKIEGIVIKPRTAVYGADKKLLMAKFVSEAFKEVHAQVWGEPKPSKGSIVDRVIKMYRSESRWNKAAQHLEERGELMHAPQDIGNLIREVISDTFDEDGDVIAQLIFSDFENDIKRGITKGLPEWWKAELAKRAFEGVEDDNV